MCSLKGKLYDGDVILSNHPMAGGSHLPDLTVVTPVSYFYNCFLSHNELSLIMKLFYFAYFSIACIFIYLFYICSLVFPLYVYMLDGCMFHVVVVLCSFIVELI